MELNWHEKQVVRPEDTPEIIEAALILAEKHKWYFDTSDGYSHRWNAVFVTEEEKDPKSKHTYGLVQRVSSYGLERFKRAIAKIRENNL